MPWLILMCMWLCVTYIMKLGSCVFNSETFITVKVCKENLYMLLINSRQVNKDNNRFFTTNDDRILFKLCMTDVTKWGSRGNVHHSECVKGTFIHSTCTFEVSQQRYELYLYEQWLHNIIQIMCDRFYKARFICVQQQNIHHSEILYILLINSR